MSRVAATVLLLVVLAAACQLRPSLGGGLQTGNLEQEIRAGLRDASGLDVTSATCPEGLLPLAGDVFVCRATLADGQVIVVEVTQQDDDGTVTWQWLRSE